MRAATLLARLSRHLHDMCDKEKKPTYYLAKIMHYELCIMH